MQEVRIDKWLWVARFFKTRSLASQAVDGGHVTLNGNRPKAAKALRVDDLLEIRLGSTRLTVRVLVLSERRGPAAVALTLYEETEESALKREQQQLERAAMSLWHGPEQRPDKHERREIRRFLKKE